MSKEERNRVLLGELEQNSVRRNELLLPAPWRKCWSTARTRRAAASSLAARRGNRVAIFDANPRLIGSLVPLKIDRATVSTLYGELMLARCSSISCSSFSFRLSLTLSLTVSLRFDHERLKVYQAPSDALSAGRLRSWRNSGVSFHYAISKIKDFHQHHTESGSEK